MTTAHVTADCFLLPSWALLSSSVDCWGTTATAARRRRSRHPEVITVDVRRPRVVRVGVASLPLRRCRCSLQQPADTHHHLYVLDAETSMEQRQRHLLVLVHGACHGAWQWYKVATMLSSAGHRVTALDMAACGARPERTEEVPSFEDYSRPLLDALAALPPDEKAILVGHSFGGLSLALAMERFPDKVAVAVFVAALMPAAGKPMDIVFQQASPPEGRPEGYFMDCETGTSGDAQRPVRMFKFGPQFLKKNLYQLSPPEDLTLAAALVRWSRGFRDDAMETQAFLTPERYGTVSKVCVIAEDDALAPADARRLMASQNPGTEVVVLQGADHMPMFSKARELSELLMEIADKYT